MKITNYILIILVFLLIVIPGAGLSQDKWFIPQPSNFLSLGDGKKVDILVVGDDNSHTQRVISEIKKVNASIRISTYPYYGVSILNPFYYADAIGIDAIVIPASNAIMIGSYLEKMHKMGLLRKDIMLFAPMPSNQHIYCYYPKNIERYVVGVSASTQSGERAIRAYGPALEFVDYVPGANFNSFVAGRVAAKFVQLKKIIQEKTDIETNWNIVRRVAREISTNKGSWKRENGYGIIELKNYEKRYGKKGKNYKFIIKDAKRKKKQIQ